MGINRLRNRISLYEVGYVPDGMGGSTKSLTLITALWARIERQDGSRVQEGGLLSTTRPVIITLRAGTYQVTTNSIIRFNGRDLTIHSVAYDERNRFTRVVAYEGNILDEYYVKHNGEYVTHNNNKITHT